MINKIEMYKNEDFRIKLIFPCRFEFSTDNPINYLPYGMGVLTAFLRRHNYYVEQEDLSIKFSRYDAFLTFIFKNIELDIRRNKDKIYDFLEAVETMGKFDLFFEKVLGSTSIEGFNLIGFSVFTYFHFIFALMLSKKIKERTDTPIVFGGPFINLYGHLYPEAFNFIDYMIVGDGRIPLLRLIDYFNHKIPLSEVPNLSYRDNGKLTTNRREHYPIEETPTPDFTDLCLKLYKNPYSNFCSYDILFPYQITKGCTNKCSFCFRSYLNGKLEFKSYDKIISELLQMKQKYNSKMFHFCDDAINNSYEYLEGLCDLFIKNRLNIHWNVYARVGNLDKHILRKMKEAGCHWLLLGIESGSDRMLKMMNKGFTSEQASRTLRESSETGIMNQIFLIPGYPNETKRDIEQTIGFIRKNRKYIDYAVIMKFYLTYGSLMYYQPERYGVVNLTPSPSFYFFCFDEVNGKKWLEKQRQQAYSTNQMTKVAYINLKFIWKCKIFLFSCFTLFRSIILKLKVYAT